MIFNYGYGCCAFAHNICGSQPVVLDGIPEKSKPLPLEFFINPRSPPGVVPTKATAIDVRPGEAMIGPEREVPTTVLEADNSEVGEYLLGAEVGPGYEPNSSARIIGESKDPVVSSGN